MLMVYVTWAGLEHGIWYCYGSYWRACDPLETGDEPLEATPREEDRHEVGR